MSELRDEIEEIKARNRRVEADKAWEVSWQRRVAIAVLTYLFALAFLFAIRVPHFVVAAGVPVLGYLISTLSLSFLRERFTAGSVDEH